MAIATAENAGAVETPRGEQMTVCHNPATGALVGRAPLHDVADLRRMLSRARETQPAWAALPVRERCAAIRRVRDLLVERVDVLCGIISDSTGKTRIDALSGEVSPATLAADYYARMAPRWLADRALKPASFLLGNKRARVCRTPYGVVGIISPWNYPFSLPFSEVVTALLAGNAVVLKVATQTQLVGVEMERLFLDAKLPDGVFSLINLPGRIVGDAFLESGVDRLIFTGSVAVGKQLMAKAAETLTPLVLELGGNDPMLVCPAADLERAANGALWAGMANAGQSCAGVERIYVHESVHDAFVERLSEKVRALRVGPDDGAHGIDMGAITTADQLQTIRAHVDEAVAQGAAIAAQSGCPRDGSGTFYPATLLTNVNHAMRVMREETFGPVIAVMKVRDMEEAVRLANDSELGLTASVWSKSAREAEQLARRIEAGVVMANDHLMSHGLPETPWGGCKQSGIGRTHGQLGFDEMTQPQCIIHDRASFLKKAFWWHPYGPEIYDGLKGMLELLYAKPLGSRIKGLRKMLRMAKRSFRS